MLAIGVLGGLTVLTGALVFAALTVNKAPATAGPPETTTAPSQAAPAVEVDALGAPVAEAIARLDDSTRAWTLTVIGDSTGNDGNEWVALTAKALGAKYDRPVVWNMWDATAHAYAAPVTISAGDNAPIQVWNASAPGQGPTYSLEHLPAMTATTSDMLILNHGHNFLSATAGASAVAEIINTTVPVWDGAAVLVTIQNPRTAEAAKQDANLKAVRDRFAAYALIDVETLWNAQPDPATLTLDGTHPNEAGTSVWMDAAKGPFAL